ncbi:MAG TPA: CRTAC1 family protein [Vicinamibacteria bacterium]|nr:CRTAC1 family protein [Vicinamibacteria bacterium]
MSRGRRGRVWVAALVVASPALLLPARGARAGGSCGAFQMAPQAPDAAKRDAPPAQPPASAAAPAGPAPAYHFVDVAAQSGLRRVVLAGRPGKDHLLDSAGTGAAWLDYDRDGLLDCYLVNDWRIEGDRIVERGRNALYKQLPDHTFKDVTDEAGVGGEGEWGAGAFVADYDGDGWPDILVTNFGKNVLYHNLGNGRFENVAKQVGLESPGWNTGAAWFDADGDGLLDVYIAQYIDTTLDEVLRARPSLSWRGLEMVAFGPFGLKGAPDHFFHNDHGHFVDATLESGLEDKALGFGFSVRVADFNGDGFPDIYVANDSDPNYLYRNDGKGHFTEVGTWTGCALDENGAAQASMGVAVGDVNQDGILDIFVDNFSEDFSTLYRGLPGGLFEDVSRKSGVGPATYKTLAWGAALADLDNDGDLDIAVMNGHIYPQIDRHPELIGTYEQRNILLDNRGPLGPGAVPTFVDVTDSAGPGWQAKRSHRGLAVADYDDDGRLDLLITALDSPPVLLHNESRTPGAWLTVTLEDRKGGICPIGAEVKVRAGGRTWWGDVASGDSYMSTHDPRPHFGLGAVKVVDEVEVRWPDGTKSYRTNVPVRQNLRIRYGG